LEFFPSSPRDSRGATFTKQRGHRAHPLFGRGIAKQKKKVGAKGGGENSFFLVRILRDKTNYAGGRKRPGHGGGNQRVPAPRFRPNVPEKKIRGEGGDFAARGLRAKKIWGGGRCGFGFGLWEVGRAPPPPGGRDGENGRTIFSWPSVAHGSLGRGTGKTCFRRANKIPPEKNKDPANRSPGEIFLVI